MTDTLHAAIVAEVRALDSAIAHEAALELHPLTRLPWSRTTGAAIEAAMRERQVALQARAGARARLTAARDALAAARDAARELEAEPALPVPQVSERMRAEFAALRARLDRALACFVREAEASA